LVKKQQQSSQLYSLFRELGQHIDSNDDLGLVVGYCVLDGTLNFTNSNVPASSGSVEQLRFDQIRSVYDSLERSIEQCKDLGDQDVAFKVICDLQDPVQEKLDKYDPGISSVEEELERIVLGPQIYAVVIMRKGDYKDRTRRFGLQLLESVNRRCKINGKRHAMLEDFERIREYFVEQR
jgi:hypothetical protein